ncbi:TPA: phage tail protein [Escherichia coli]|nr:phage tail protein [Escherichia coli]HDX9441380.1 phage tail protein [Escherichia coli]
MHRIDTKTAQKDKFGAGKNGFTRGNPQTGTPATDLDDDYFDMLQEELCSVVEASGASLEKERHDQLLTALRALLLSRKNPFGDIKSDGTVKTALENLDLTDLGIGKNIAGSNINLLSSATSSGFYAYGGNTDPDFGIDYGMVLTLLYDSVSKQRVQIYLPLVNSAGATPIIRAVTGNTTIWKYKLFSEKYKPTPADVGMGSGAPAIGVPFFWPSAAMPNTVISEWSDMVFLKFNGASFSAAVYPKLAQVFPGLTLPEARGEFPRIWDDGRGVDSGRALLSTQVDAIRNITGEVGFVQYFGNTTNSGALYSGGAQNLTNLQPGGSTVAQSILFSAGKDPSVSIANENRPRNIAFNFLVRAK